MAIETTISNEAIGRIGGARLNDYETDTSVEAIQCRLHYDRVKKVLLRSYEWNFAIKRASLSKNTTAPNHGWDNAFDLPNDYIRLKKVYDVDNESYSLEGSQILTDYSDIQIEYVANIEDPAEFDELFTELCVLKLAIKILPAIAGTGYVSQSLLDKLQNEFNISERKAQRVNRQESNSSGSVSWNQARTMTTGLNWGRFEQND